MYVGVILSVSLIVNLPSRIPHVCGGDLRCAWLKLPSPTYSPCMWGWSLGSVSSDCCCMVFPMYVGVILYRKYFIELERRIPHVCGGDPFSAIPTSQSYKYSPCMWGWSYHHWHSRAPVPVFPMYVGVILWQYDRYRTKEVFPMYVGVILWAPVQLAWLSSIPHVCGGDPKHKSTFQAGYKYSPCMWGWSFWTSITASMVKVFPMYVGVILHSHV